MKKVPFVAAWAIAFAFVEAAVVEYLRALYYPLERGGFQFPLQTWEDLCAMGWEHLRRLYIELGREAATLVMLATLGGAVGGNRREAWAHFMIAFGVWDIFYYVWLKLFLDWPAHLLTWDLLFLLPVPWVAPVLAPVIISLCLIGAGLTVLAYEQRERPLLISWGEWGLISAGGFVVILSFCLDAGNVLAGAMPRNFSWSLFLLGLATSVVTFARALYRNRQ
uniref:Uncharacterized protein n=1 Tax=Desulfomonile tiedjei TaxID=2358 RepID=A0A7C4EXG7_9BACT